ncbi:MAG: BMC domain-containing protein [Deltaproteobacteria bacterium]|jgi:microcompartment protein CcmL/EutN|nr:BMC domain-containing protein [Deltaproteobacteria bacterium]MBW2237448.1 BMC domain-containing protein [Deltaproteobacteria bacterium]MBW2570993.1 BMC domain-containing protein [Deltaproteobacteria bacterium]MBW2710475.1 BMC domain-containing protein [Deltaproteobacteria bacterium]NOQ18540.1 BMC domain-containing protein [Desulfobacterales bacterium]
MKKQSLGLIETWGFIPAIEAADAGAKAADVILIGYEITKVALVTVKFMGDVAAVKAAVSAGAAAAGKVGKVVAVHVIPRPDRQVHIAFSDRPPPSETKTDEPKPPVAPAPTEKIAAKSTPPRPSKVKEAKDVSKEKTPLQKKRLKVKQRPKPSSKKKTALPKKKPKPKGKAKKSDTMKT